MEPFAHEGGPLVIVDYAHSPDALSHVLTTLNEHQPKQLLCVVGCGGNRDVGKRALMAELAERHADRVLLTSDNPRNEAAESIINDMLQGIHEPDKVIIEMDRAQAISRAIAAANEDDIVLVAGKGHEDYQEVGGVRIPFSDRQVVQDCLEARHD